MNKISLLTVLLPMVAFANDGDYRLMVKDHRFQPTELTIPSGSKIRLLIENQDDTPEEFESHALNREKVIPSHGKAYIFIGPLDPGRYPFIGEFNEATAHGVIIAQ